MAAIVQSFANWIAGAISGKGVTIKTLEETEGKVILLVSDGAHSCRITIEDIE